MKRLISGLPLLFFTAATLLAQDDATATPMELSNGAKAGLWAAFAGFCFIWIIFLVIWLGIAIWVIEGRETPPVAECHLGHGSGLDSGYYRHWIDCSPRYAA
jgi:hypothetical protein